MGTSLGTVKYIHTNGQSIIANLLNDYPKIEYDGKIYNSKEHLIYIMFGKIYTTRK